jgi:chemotaxis protein methyltransferase CheR
MTPDRNLTDVEFTGLREFIYKKTGIFFTERNRFLLDARIREILHQTGHRDAISYVKYLHDPGVSPLEVSRLINKVTITETSFFRDPHQISAIAKNVYRRSQEGMNNWGPSCLESGAPHLPPVKRLTRWPSF